MSPAESMRSAAVEQPPTREPQTRVPLLEIRGLSITYRSLDGDVDAVRGSISSFTPGGSSASQARVAAESQRSPTARSGYYDRPP